MAIAGAEPIPNNGMAIPNNAILGIAWTILAKPKIGLFNFFTYLTNIPNGTPKTIASNTEKTVNLICCISKVNISFLCSSM